LSLAVGLLLGVPFGGLLLLARFAFGLFTSLA
jgi:hypothetical protein